MSSPNQFQGNNEDRYGRAIAIQPACNDARPRRRTRRRLPSSASDQRAPPRSANACQIVLAHLIRHHSICDGDTPAIVRSWIEPRLVFPTTRHPIKPVSTESDLS
jgi:hypothetical protein